MNRSLSTKDVERLTVKFKVLSLKMRGETSFSDRVTLGVLDEAIRTRSIPHDKVHKIHELLTKYEVG